MMGAAIPPLLFFGIALVRLLACEGEMRGSMAQLYKGFPRKMDYSGTLRSSNMIRSFFVRTFREISTENGSLVCTPDSVQSSARAGWEHLRRLRARRAKYDVRRVEVPPNTGLDLRRVRRNLSSRGPNRAKVRCRHGSEIQGHDCGAEDPREGR